MSEGITNENMKAEIAKAHKEGRMGDVARLTGIPLDVIEGKRVLSRRERRQWYHENRKRLGLPAWSKLEELKNE